MRVVLYDDETMEPLTVLHLPSWMPPRLRNGERMVIPVMRKLDLSASYGGDTTPPMDIQGDRVGIWFEKFLRHDQLHWFAFTRDSENALSLKSVFLPGQWSDVHAEYQRGVGDGIVRALGAVLKN